MLRGELMNTGFEVGDVMNMGIGICSRFSLIDLLNYLESYQEQEELLKFCYDSLGKK